MNTKWDYNKNRLINEHSSFMGINYIMPNKHAMKLSNKTIAYTDSKHLSSLVIVKIYSSQLLSSACIFTKVYNHS